MEAEVSLLDLGTDEEVGQAPRPVRPTSKHLWRWFLVLEGFYALIYFPFGLPPERPFIFGVLPWMEWPGQPFAWACIGLSAVAAIAYGVWRNRPNAPIAWWFLGGGVLLFISGDTIYKFWHQIMGQQNIPFPSFIDVIYITMYPVVAIGLLLLTRARLPGGNRASLIDALTVTLGVGLLSWIFLIGPNVRADHEGLLVRLTSAAYPLGDVLVLAMLAHLWSAGGFRNPAGRLLAIGALGTLVSDSVYGLANLHLSANWSDGNPVDLGWILFYACWGAAALHPSMRELSEPRRAVAQRTTWSRLGLLAAASLIAPTVLLVETLMGNPVDAPMIAVVAGAMFLLVLLRMAGLIWERERAEVREQVLRKSASELVAASGREAIYQATMTGLDALVAGHEDSVEISLAVIDPAGALNVVARSGNDSLGESTDMTALWAELQESPLDGPAVTTAADAGPSSQLLVYPLGTQDLRQGMVVASSVSDIAQEMQNAIEILVAQVDMALDRECMTETIHARRSEARFQTLVQNASDVILIARPDTTISYQTPSSMRTLGYEPGSLEGIPFISLVHPDDQEQALAVFTGVAFRGGTSVTAQWRILHDDGSWHHAEVIATNLLTDETVEGIVLTLRDVTERRSLEEELKHQAFHDGLSGLANRALFRDRLDHALDRAARSKASLAVLFLDLDDFKLVNDSLGHASGDTLLIEVANRLSDCLRGGDTAARFGGDEFAILMEELVSIDEACDVADRITAALREPIMVLDREIRVRASIGIALNRLGTEDSAELIQAADVAMYAAKAGGKGRYEIYQPSLQASVVERLERTADLQRAVDEGEFELFYQPILSLAGSAGIGFEALIRWRHPERGLLLPEEFISLAEETGLIVPLGRWVLNTACLQARQWQRHFPEAMPLRLSVNISARHFQHDSLVPDVARALEDSGFDAHSLVIEITEYVLVQDTETVISRMMALKELGVSLAIDDFGTGYSSLSYLKSFPIDILKVDKAFVDDVMEDSALAEAIVRLGQTMHLQTVAEGIEQAGQLEALRAFGCDFGQGFYLARPLHITEFSKFLSSMAPGALPIASSAVTEEPVR
jgi:diguanylate cyclase (GGDEF)-like protein/PAS domain S-box-containing protein